MTGFRTLALSVALAAVAVPSGAQGDVPAPPPPVTPRILLNAGCSTGAVYSVASDQLGNVTAAGYCGDLNGAHQGFVMRADPDGTVQWTYRPGGSMRATSLALDAAGDVLVAGHTGTGDSAAGVVLKIDAKGAPVWSRAVDPSLPGSSSSCASVAASADSSVYASCGGSSAPSGAIVAFDADGTPLWRRDGFEAAQNLSMVNGKLYAASSTNASIIDQASGIVLSDVRVSDSGSIRVGRDGKVYVKSSDAAQAGATIAVYDEALNPLGSVVLNAAVGAARSYDAFDVDVHGNIYALGAYYATAGMTGGGTFVAAFTAAGDLLWQSPSDPSASFTPAQSPSVLNAALGGSMVSVSDIGKCFVSTSLSLLEFPAR